MQQNTYNAYIGLQKKRRKKNYQKKEGRNKTHPPLLTLS